MTGLEVIGIILALGIALLIDSVAIIAAVSKLIDSKMKVKAETELAVFKEEMGIFSKLIDKAISTFGEMITKDTKKT